MKPKNDDRPPEDDEQRPTHRALVNALADPDVTDPADPAVREAIETQREYRARRRRQAVDGGRDH